MPPMAAGKGPRQRRPVRPYLRAMNCSSDALSLVDLLIVVSVFWAFFLGILVASLLVIARREASRSSALPEADLARTEANLAST